MMLLTRDHNATEFRLYWSHVNQQFIFQRNDCGSNTETTMFRPSEKQEAIAYFKARWAFFCEVAGIENC